MLELRVRSLRSAIAVTVVAGCLVAGLSSTVAAPGGIRTAIVARPMPLA